MKEKVINAGVEFCWSKNIQFRDNIKRIINIGEDDPHGESIFIEMIYDTVKRSCRDVEVVTEKLYVFETFSQMEIYQCYDKV